METVHHLSLCSWMLPNLAIFHLGAYLSKFYLLVSLLAVRLFVSLFTSREEEREEVVSHRIFNAGTLPSCALRGSPISIPAVLEIARGMY